MCKGSVTLSAGSGAFVNSCVTTSCVPWLRDQTNMDDPVTSGLPTTGVLPITGVGNDVILAVCQ